MSERTTLDEAAGWFLRLQEKSADAGIFLEWQRWLALAPENRAAYEQIEETILGLRLPDAPPLPSAGELAMDDYDGSQSIRSWKAARRSESAGPGSRRAATGRWQSSSWRRSALAAGVAVFALIGGVLWLRAGHEAQHGIRDYQTSAGQRRALTLPEGSKVTLDADSALRMRLTPQRRSFTLTRGEAFFEVARDPSRPFTVRAGDTVIRAIGTSFNVRVNENRTVVAVTEGRVEITPVRVSSAAAATSGTQQVGAGEAVSYLSGGAASALPATEASIATTWLEGPRQYRNEPLRYVLADIDRYTGRRITIADEATGNLRFTGTLDLDNSEAWLRGLAIALPVTIREDFDGGLAIRPRGNPP